MEPVWSAPGRRVWLAPAGDPPRLEAAGLARPFALLIVATEPAPEAYRRRLADQLVAKGCRHAACWGAECEEWQSAVDDAYLRTRPGLEPDDDTLVMTTAHPRELVTDAVWYLLRGCQFGQVRFEDYVVLHVGDDPQARAEVRAAVRHVLAN